MTTWSASRPGAVRTVGRGHSLGWPDRHNGSRSPYLRGSVA